MRGVGAETGYKPVPLFFPEPAWSPARDWGVRFETWGMFFANPSCHPPHPRTAVSPMPGGPGISTTALHDASRGSVPNEERGSGVRGVVMSAQARHRWGRWRRAEYRAAKAWTPTCVFAARRRCDDTCWSEAFRRSGGREVVRGELHAGAWDVFRGSGVSSARSTAVSPMPGGPGISTTALHDACAMIGA